MTRSPRPIIFKLLVFVALSISGCDCSRKGGLQQSFAEIGVVWTNDQGVELTNREAVYDFGAARMGERVGRQLVVRNLGGGPLTLVSLERLDGDPVTIGTAAEAGAAFD